MKKIYLALLILTIMGNTMESKAQSIYHNDENVAINGYDVVNYFTDSKAVKGSSDYSTSYKGSTFYFLSEDHKKAFIKEPEKYTPQFNGYCAYAVGAMNKKVPTNPGTFKIVDGKLYLFFNDLWDGKQFNTLDPWNEDEANLLPTANTNWEALKDQP